MRPVLFAAGLALVFALPAHAQHARVFISPMGEPFHGDSANPPEVAWFNGVDANHDGRISQAEMEDDAVRFFKTLDTDHDGELDPTEIEHYETVVAPEVGAHGDGAAAPDPETNGPDETSPGTTTPAGSYKPREGAALFSYIAVPEPVTATDTNFDRSVTLREFLAAADRRFRMLDTNSDGMIDRAELPNAPHNSDEMGGSKDSERKHRGHHGGGN